MEDIDADITTHPGFRSADRMKYWKNYVTVLRNMEYGHAESLQKCVGPCYAKGTRAKHPSTNQDITEYTHAFCPTEMWIDKDKMQFTDKCTIPTNHVHTNTFAAGSQKICANTLAPLHKIYDYRSAYKWSKSKKNHASMHFKRKVLNCAYKFFYDKDDKDKYKEKHLKHYYNRFRQWAPTFARSLSKKIEGESYTTENIIEKWGNDRFIGKCIKSYVADFKLDWLSIHLDEREVFRRLGLAIYEDIIKRQKREKQYNRDDFRKY